MRVFLAVLVLIFSFQSWTKADDIRDFEIEGMSIGDSLLDYFSEEEIKSMTVHTYPNNIYLGIIYNISSLNIYELVQFDVDKEKNYEIIRIVGRIYYKDNINDCYKLKDQIVSEISGIFNEDVKIVNKKAPLSKLSDKTGKSIGTSTNFYFKNNTGDFIQVMCRDYSKESGKEDALNVEIWSSEYRDYRKTL